MRPRSALTLVLSCVLLLTPAMASAQTMRDALNRLFVFGGGDDPLFLGGSAGLPSTEIHAGHFLPAELEANSTLLAFFNNSIATNVSSFPLSSTVASQTFVFVEGVPVPSSNSFGPIFAERAQTLGRGRLNAGMNYSRIDFSKIRGVDLDDVQLTFVHEDVDFPGCDGIFEGDCSLYGFPQFENDLLELALDLDIRAEVYAFYTTFGLTDWLDVSVAIPVVDMRLDGRSVARVTVTTEDEALHFFGGTPEDPEAEARSQSREGTTGLGDIATRLKARIVRGETFEMALLGEARAPTGREEDFLGTGDWNAKGLAIFSGTLSDFAPHLNIGYEFRGSDLDDDEVEIIVGFDHRLADWATLAVDFLSAFKVGEQELILPEPVDYEAPFPRTIQPTNIPSRRDDIIDGSIGFKLRTAGGVVIITNVLVPLNDGGLRSEVIPTVGVEYTL